MKLFSTNTNSTYWYDFKKINTAGFEPTHLANRASVLTAKPYAQWLRSNFMLSSNSTYRAEIYTNVKNKPWKY